ncbi:MAG: sugar transferase [Anaerolineae bacterium]|nr:sugar transferase [Anaerolineae bacterium]
MFKRIFDIVASAIGLILLSPFLLGVAIAVRITSRGPVFYRARRVGQHGHEFTLYKFRSMVANADRQGPGITGANDQRVTPVGHILRRTKLDELPQLFNVLRGQMSIVGPRPEDPRYVALYTPAQRQVLKVRPGITSLASMQFRDETVLLDGDDWERQYIEKVMPAKLAIDLEYARRARLQYDILIALQTIWSLVSDSFVSHDHQKKLVESE